MTAGDRTYAPGSSGSTTFVWNGGQQCGRFQPDIAIDEGSNGDRVLEVGVVVNTGVDCSAVSPEPPPGVAGLPPFFPPGVAGLPPLTPAAACSPGYWGNHTDNWPAPYRPRSILWDEWMLASLEYGGDDAWRRLLRHGTAAALNAQMFDDYGISPQEVIDTVWALEDASREEQNRLKDQYDRANNQAPCPLN